MAHYGHLQHSAALSLITLTEICLYSKQTQVLIIWITEQRHCPGDSLMLKGKFSSLHCLQASLQNLRQSEAMQVIVNGTQHSLTWYNEQGAPVSATIGAICEALALHLSEWHPSA